MFVACRDSLHWINAAIIPVAAVARGGGGVASGCLRLLSHVEWRVHLIYPIKVFAINPVKAND